MKKPKYITVDNYKQFLPSEFVRSFVSDIEVAEKIGKPMDMFNYSAEDTTHDCLPCLGGMACMNFGLPARSITCVKSIWRDEVSRNTAKLGDSIRMGTTSRVLENLYYLYPDSKMLATLKGQLPKHAISFGGEEQGERLVLLKKQVHQYADALEAAGY